MDQGRPTHVGGRTLSDFEPLWSAEKKLLLGARAGELTSLSRTCPKRASCDNKVRAAFIRFLALGGDAQAPVHEHGVELEGAWFVGPLDLRAARVPHPLILQRCRFEQVSMLNSVFDGYLDLEGSHLTLGMVADNLQCRGGVCLRNGFRAEGKVHMANARIGSFLDCWGGVFENDGGTSLDLSGCRVESDILLCNGFLAVGQVSLVNAFINGNLVCDSARFSFLSGKAIHAEGAIITGSVFCRDFIAAGQLNFLRTRIGGVFQSRRATIHGYDGSALNLRGAKVAGEVDIGEGARLNGAIDFTNASIEGMLNISSAEIDAGAANMALLLVNAQVGGSINIDQNCRFVGGIDMDRCEVGGRISFYGGSIRCQHVAWSALRSTVAGDVNLDGVEVFGLVDFSAVEIAGSWRMTGLFEVAAGTTIRAEQARIMRHIEMMTGFRARGEVSLYGANVGGYLLCDGGSFEGQGGDALNAEAIQVAGSVFLRSNFSAQGLVNLTLANIGHNLECTGGKFDAGSSNCLDAWRVAVGGDLNLLDYVGRGTTIFTDARIGNNASCLGSNFVSPGGKALSFSGAVIQNDLCTSWEEISGQVDLSGVNAGSLTDTAESWSKAQGNVLLDGLSVGRFGSAAPTDAPMRIAWLGTQCSDHLDRNFRPQPWEHTIAVLRGMGHPNAAKFVAIAKQERLRKAGRIPRGERPFHYLYGLLVGYGYRPSRLIAITVAVWLLCAFVYNRSASEAPAIFAPTEQNLSRDDRNAAYAAFSGLAYSADVLLPIVDLGYKDQWLPVAAPKGIPRPAGRWLRVMWWLEATFGWIAGILIVGVLTPLLRKD